MNTKTAPSKDSQLKGTGSIAADLETNMRSHLSASQEMLNLIRQKRQAIRVADITMLQKICAEEDAVAQQLSALARQRASIVKQASGAKSLALKQLIATLPEPTKPILEAVIMEIEAVGDQIRRESGIVRIAAEALSRHMSGIILTVQSALSRVGVYGERGCVNHGISIAAVVDIKS